MNPTDEALMDEFDAEPLVARPPATSACAFRPYPSLDVIPAPPSSSAPPLPRYPSLRTAAPAEHSIATGAPSLVVTKAPSVSSSGQDAHPMRLTEADDSACEEKERTNMAHAPSPAPMSSAAIIAQAAEIDALTQHESAVQAQEVRSMQAVFDHIGQALRGETPHQIEQRRLREAARLERAEERAQRALARQASSSHHPGHRPTRSIDAAAGEGLDLSS